MEERKATLDKKMIVPRDDVKAEILINFVMAGNHPVVGTDTFACAHIEAPPAPCALVSRRAPWVDGAPLTLQDGELITVSLRKKHVSKANTGRGRKKTDLEKAHARAR